MNRKPDPSAIRDYTLRTAPAELQARVAALIKTTYGVTLTYNGVWTLTHDATGAWLQKPHTLTLFGAWRAAAHMHRSAHELGPDTAEMPRFGNRQNHR